MLSQCYLNIPPQEPKPEPPQKPEPNRPKASTTTTTTTTSTTTTLGGGFGFRLLGGFRVQALGGWGVRVLPEPWCFPVRGGSCWGLGGLGASRTEAFGGGSGFGSWGGFGLALGGVSHLGFFFGGGVRG